SLAVGAWALAAIANVEAPCRMSTVGQSVSTDGNGSAAAIAERSAGVVCTGEKPGIDGNQSELPPPEKDEQPTRPRATSAPTPTAADRLTKYALRMAPAGMWNGFPLA